ncbi:hypothetical protein Rs2_05546 [Raphanus sativus]|nr:hypothetical protein Rs2_05546 [Raphanus sativus]
MLPLVGKVLVADERNKEFDVDVDVEEMKIVWVLAKLLSFRSNCRLVASDPEEAGVIEYNTLLKSLKTRRDSLCSKLSELLEAKVKLLVVLTIFLLETVESTGPSLLHNNGRFRNIDDSDSTGADCDSVSNNGSWSGDSEDHKEKAAPSTATAKQETIPGAADKWIKLQRRNCR